jgi:uncharacterized protein DUF4154
MFRSQNNMVRFIKNGKWLCGLLLVVNTSITFNLFANNFSETEIKAGYVYNFLHFIEWPSQIQSALNICLYNSDKEYTSSFKSMPAITKAGKPLKIIHLKINENPSEIDDCHILFFTKNQPKNVSTLLKKATNNHILTIGEIDGFLEQGGMINFFINNEKVAFEISKSAFLKADLKVSSQVLRIAERIFQDEDND